MMTGIMLNNIGTPGENSKKLTFLSLLKMTGRVVGVEDGDGVAVSITAKFWVGEAYRVGIRLTGSSGASSDVYEYHAPLR
jgi:hypothetical protein